MYDWQQHATFTAPLLPGMAVKLNPRWMNYDYLKREYGHLFPAGIREVHGDIYVIGKVRFARQCLAMVNE